MSGETQSDFSRAIAQLTVFTLWREAGLPAAPSKDGQYKSPFREERSASFSVLGGGKGFKDFGSDQKGGLIDFAKLAWPNKNADEIKELLIDLAGTRSVRPPAAAGKVVPFDKDAPPAVGPSVVVAPTDPRVLKAAKTIERNAQLRQAEAAIYEEREEQLRPYVNERKAIVPAWPDFVAARYAEGVAQLVADRKRQEQLAQDRGWPLAWVEELLALELVSYPLERWTEAGQRYARRQKAFRVDFPQVVHYGAAGAGANLVPIGYHQRFFKPGQGDEKARKGWLYVPSFPKSNTRSDFETAIVKCGLERGLHAGDETNRPDGFIPPLPFVMGDLEKTRTIVLLEGQWDAITFFGACGWFHDTSPPAGVAIFGIRGAQGVDNFLGYYQNWLQANRPLAWLIADNDNAGKAWREAPAAEPGKLQPPSLAERLEAAGCRQVLVSWLRPDPTWGKDFNDYYRAAKPTPTVMYKWMQKVGVLDAMGGWA